MIKINAIKIEVNTNTGLFGADYEFSDGFNIIRGDNTSGKSSLFQSILYCFGFEELIGGKNEKTMQSVLKDVVEFPKNTSHRVLQSQILLEFENQHEQVITVRRSVIDTYRYPQLVDVYDGGLLTGKTKVTSSQPMFIHDKGGASDEIYGFHMFLEKFLDWNLPIVYNKVGERRKLYIQQIAPSFIIEQKSGWSDFLATMPFYGLTNKEARVIEFLLNLDVYENKQTRQKLITSLRIIEDKRAFLYKQLIKLAERGGGKLVNLESKPSILNKTNPISILIFHNSEYYSIQDYINLLNEQLAELENKNIPKVSDKVQENELMIDSLNDSINTITLNYELLFEEVCFDNDKLKRYQLQLESLKEDLRKNKGAQKVKKLGAEIDSKIAQNLCPTCEQPIKDSLLPSDISQNPMLIEDNVNFIEAQIKMIKIYIEGLEYSIAEKEEKLSSIRTFLSSNRYTLREIKKELVTDDRLPSEIEIERKLNLKKKIEFYYRFLDEFNSLFDDVNMLSSDFEKLLKYSSNLPRDFFSVTDRRKLSFLLRQFKRLLVKFDYKSKTNDYIDISMENYLPVAQKQFGEDMKSYDLRFDSSASDFIRCIWAYTCSLFLTSNHFSANHPRLLMFDEPKQQDISLNHFRSFLEELSTYKGVQILLFASFENSNESYLSATEGLDFNLIHIDKKLIKPINS